MSYFFASKARAAPSSCDSRAATLATEQPLSLLLLLLLIIIIIIAIILAIMIVVNIILLIVLMILILTTPITLINITLATAQPRGICVYVCVCV